MRKESQVRSKIRYIRRNTVIEREVDPNRTLLDVLRLDEKATGTKEGCNEGDCGACTVILARLKNGKVVYEPVNSCILLAGQADGAEIITVEDLAHGGNPHPIQQAMVDHHGSQCGFCTPGIVMSLFALYHSGERATRAAINDQLAGNLCRCTGYRPIVDAALAVCDGHGIDQFSQSEDGRANLLQSLSDAGDVFVGTADRFFAAPAKVASLADLLRRYPDARLVAGATDVGLWLTKRLDDIPRVIWLGRIAELQTLDAGEERVTIGAAVTLHDAFTALASIDPDIGATLRRFGSAQVRASGTVGGNIANGSPIGDLAPCLIALDGDVTLQRGDTVRTVALEDFFIAYGKQDRAADEFVRSVSVPRLAAKQHFRAFKVSKRFDEDISAVMGAFCLGIEDRRVVTARIAFGGMAATPRRAAETEKMVVGLQLDDPMAWEAAIEAIGRDFQPIDDARATASYRLTTARALLQKTLFEISAAPSSITRINPTREAAE